VPAVPAKTGYGQTAPKWNKTLTNITADMTIEAVYTINRYTVIFQLPDGTVDSSDVIYLLWYTVYGEAEYPLH